MSTSVAPNSFVSITGVPVREGCEPMLIQSFDIGIKHMAYCILAVDKDKKTTIQDWQVLDLLHVDQSTPMIHLCTCTVGSSKQKHVCNKKAKFHKSFVDELPTQQYFCARHAQGITQRGGNGTVLMPEKRFQHTALNKMKVEELYNLSREFSVNLTDRPEKKLSKKHILSILEPWFAARCLEMIPVGKKKTCNTIDLITIGRNMTALLDVIPNLNQLTHVIMENQISPIAGRMKTIQGMLMQYYIMRHPQVKIAFISSANKLKVDLPHLVTETHVSDASNVDMKTSATYRQHKTDAVQKTIHFLQQPSFESHATFFQESKSKKDDLADCFLQGLWYKGNQV